MNMITLSAAKFPPPPPLKPPPPPLNSRQKQSSPSSIKYPPLEKRLISQINTNNLNEAFSTLNLMTKQNLHPHLITYSLLLKHCIRSRNFHLGQLLHTHLTQSKLDIDSVLYNSLISLYSKSGDVSKAKLIFDTMPRLKKDLVSYSAMISCFANNKMELDGILMFIDMISDDNDDRGFVPNEYCFTAVIRACSNIDNVRFGMVVFGLLMKCAYFEDNVNVGCALIDMFVRGSGDLESAYKVFDKMADKNLVAWTLMITRSAQLGYPKDAVRLFLDMMTCYVPDKFTLSGVVSACAEMGSLSFGKQLHSLVIKLGLALDVIIGCSLVDMYAKCTNDGSMDSSQRVFDFMPERNVMLWTALITGYAQSGRQDNETLRLFSEMVKGPVAPNQFTFSSTLKACGNLYDTRVGEQVHALALKMGLSSINCVGNSLISMYARLGKMENAERAFGLLFEKNLVTYNTIVDAYTKNSNTEEAFELFNKLDDSGIQADAFMFSSLLSGASNVGAIGKGEQIHAQVVKSGFQSNLQICHALISMYSRCGNLEASFRVFKKMEDRNVISWTSMIMGLAIHGFADKALETFYNMVDARIKPNEITYVAVLTACSHAGLISEGRELFSSMYKDHGIVPRMEHYACMIDLLGRSGSLEEAVELITNMPFEADALVWRSLLGACRVHGNTKLGEHAAKQILKQTPNDPAAHVLLSNLYASSGKWDQVAEIRKNMKEKKVVKLAGCSWMEVKNTVHKFYVADTSHPQTKQIYVKLDELVLKIKELGYVPETSLVLHDIEEEQKEEGLNFLGETFRFLKEDLVHPFRNCYW
ncbi:hypothetical protein ACFE04_027170 [Oxalis oulophora]